MRLQGAVAAIYNKKQAVVKTREMVSVICTGVEGKKALKQAVDCDEKLITQDLTVFHHYPNIAFGIGFCAQCLNTLLETTLQEPSRSRVTGKWRRARESDPPSWAACE